MAAPPLTPPRAPAPERAGAVLPSKAPVTGPPARRGPSESSLLLAVVALLGAACLPLARVFATLDFVRPVAAAVLLSVGIAWATRRARGGPVVALVASAAGYALLVSLAFLPQTLAFGILPTAASAGAGLDLWRYGMELVHSRPAPAFPEDGLLLLTVTGIWWVAHVVEGLVFRLAAPLRAIAMALVAWTVPLALAPPVDAVWSSTLPLLLAAAMLLLASGTSDLSRWGSWTGGSRSARRNPLVVAAWPVAVLAMAAGVVFGGSLPGYGEAPWYELRGSGASSTLTTNPIVSLRTSLVDLGTAPVVRVTSPQPVYLRLTALDVYSEQEEWRSDGIRAGNAGGRLPFEAPISFYREVDVEVEVQGLTGAVIVPVPYHPSLLGGSAAEGFRYDPSRATVTRTRGGIDRGDRYTVTAAVPAPPPDLLLSSGVTPYPQLVDLPGDVPQEVADLARRIVEEAGAATPFEQALAIQEELRSWSYSLDPPQGHGAGAMRSFLEERIGYCEQFAGTMAVMLRTLGIPSRVAVGYTPGQLVDPAAGVYQVRNANAHAWVEVLFDQLGWIAFEPTPRDDGNVLVPSPVDLAPTQLESELEPDPESSPQPAPQDDIPDLRNEPRDETPRDLEDPQSPEGGAAGSGAEGGGGAWPWVLLPLLALGGAGLVVSSRRATASAAVPSAVVLDALARVERLAAGLGVGRRDSETDAELLARLVPDDPDGLVLARAAERARWAPTVPAEDAEAASQAASTLATRLLAGRGRLSRGLVRARAAVAGPLAAVRRGARRTPSPEDEGATGSAERLRRLIARRRRTR